ncbi:right-handed parallel beta-helix repeat-containing protein [Pararobbsia alpina]|uniref:Uncharacterized protein n=1 Tax=Pararobbsia alpina TaxID=621374 RepID=A0A6S7B2S3_9BURK|nr:right-handed parallel beta-helix repeat-containing protein [Pararobbsia alpina]CAB3786069.1 hypothetical protein LMG28138_02154 [Pararobbsia alpina]
MFSLSGAFLSAPSQALTVYVTATATNAAESSAISKPAGSVNLAAGNLALRDVISVLNANKARAGTNIDSLDIVLAAGVYQLASTLTLTPDASWSTTPLSISGPAGGGAIITGGHVVNFFSPVKDAATVARLPSGARGSVMVADLKQNGITNLGTVQRHGMDIPITPAPLELFFRGQPMTLARWPNTGFATIASLPGGPNGLSFTVVGGHTAAWQTEPDLEAMGYWARDWADTTLAVQSVDASGTITLAAPAPEYGLAVNQRFFIQNALSELDQPGEYYVDRTNARVYIWPPAAMTDGDVTASVVDSLLVVNNALNMTIQNLTFDTARGDGLQLLGGGKITVDHVAFRNMGDRGAMSNAGSSGFSNVTVENTGEGGLTIYGGNRTTLVAGNSFVTNSTIRNYARRTRAYRPAISLSGVGDTISGNTLYNGPHAAIIYSGNDHLISNNEIYDVVTETADSGAIYTGRDWSARGTVIADNFIHDIGTAAQPTATVGVYLDDQICGTTVERNVFSHVNQAVFIGGGRDNLVSDNLFSNSSPAILVDSRGLSWQKAWSDDPNGIFRTQLAAVHYDQPPYSTRYPLLAVILSNMPGAPLNNLLSRNIVIGGTPLSADAGAQQYLTVDQMFASQDVVFATSMSDAARTTFSDFVLAPSSPAIAAGFQRSQFAPASP